MGQYYEICKQATSCTDDCCQCLKEEEELTMKKYYEVNLLNYDTNNIPYTENIVCVISYYKCTKEELKDFCKFQLYGDIAEEFEDINFQTITEQEYNSQKDEYDFIFTMCSPDKKETIMKTAMSIIDEHLDIYNISREQKEIALEYIKKHWLNDQWDKHDDFYNYVLNILDDIKSSRLI